MRKVVDGDADGAINDPSDGDEETEFVYGGRASWQLLEEYDTMGTGAVLRASYAYGNYIDEIVEALRDTDKDLVVDDPLYYHQDDLFSVYAITDASGAVVERYDYSDYGEVTVQRADGTVKPEEYWLGNRHTYTGRLVEWDTGLLQYRHRYLSPTLGRFVQRDPLGYVDGMSEVAYVATNPASRMDPSGLGWICKRGLRPLLDIQTDPVDLRVVPSDRIPSIPIWPGWDWTIPTPQVPLRPWIAPINPFTPDGTWHEHVWFEEDRDGDGYRDNIGFFDDGLRSDNANRHQYRDCDYFPNDEALRRAAQKCQESGRYTDPGYNLFANNCQDFADCVRREYKRLTSPQWTRRWVPPLYERYSPSRTFPGYGRRLIRPGYWTPEYLAPEFDPMNDKTDPGFD